MTLNSDHKNINPSIDVVLKKYIEFNKIDKYFANNVIKYMNEIDKESFNDCKLVKPEKALESIWLNVFDAKNKICKLDKLEKVLEPMLVNLFSPKYKSCK